MNEMDINLDTEIRRWQEKLFTRSIRRKRKLTRLTELVGPTLNLHCLEISAGDGMISQNLRDLGGSWKTAAPLQAAVESIGRFITDVPQLISGSQLPFEDNMFDRVVIVDALIGFADDYSFIRECHRVLKNDGWVIITEKRRMNFSLASMLRRLCGIAPVAQGLHRNGYQNPELFNNLKDGFDVPETICFSNGLLEAISVIGELIQYRMFQGYYWMVPGEAAKDLLYRYRRLFTLSGLAYPLILLLSTLEFLPGHQLLIKSRRRHWRPRRQPKLIDGRSIAEAAINTKIGTAAPF